MDDKYSPKYRVKYQNAINNCVAAVLREDNRRCKYWGGQAIRYLKIAQKIYEAEWKFKLRVANKLNKT